MTGPDREYAEEVRDHPEVPPAQAEGKGRFIGRMRTAIALFIAIPVVFVLGGAAYATYNWWQTRPNPQVLQLTDPQYEALAAAADPNSRGFNDGAIGALWANGYRPAAQRTDDNRDTYHVVMVKCQGDDHRACYRALGSQPGPVVYLGIPDALADNPQSVRFSAARVMVEFRLDGNRTQQCAVYRGKAMAGEPGPVTYNLPQTVAKLVAFAGERTFTNESPDGDLSFWYCEPQDAG